MVFFLDLFPFALVSFLLFALIIYLIIQGVPHGLAEMVGEYNILAATNLTYAAIFFLFLILLLIWNLIFIIITNHYLDCWIITDRRTIHTELRGFFSRFYSSVSHYKVQDVTVDVHGILPTVMKYGDMKIQTAGSFRKFVFRQIPNPYEAKKALLQASDRYRGYKKGKRVDFSS